VNRIVGGYRLIMVPIMSVIVSMVVMMIVVTVIVATGMPRGHDDNLRLGLRRNQSEQPHDRQDQQKELFHIMIATVIRAHLPVCFPTIVDWSYTLLYPLHVQK